MKIPVPLSVVSRCLGVAYRLLRLTLRLEIEGRERLFDALEQGRLVVLAGWHNELFCMPYMYRMTPGHKWVAIVSASKDGEVLAGVLNGLGIATARGSSSRSGVRALMGAVRMMKKQRMLGFVTVDGPRGPRHEVKDGVLFMAAKADALVVPVRARSSRRFVFAKAWDKFELPLPTARCRIVFGEPYALESASLDADSLARERARLTDRLNALSDGF